MAVPPLLTNRKRTCQSRTPYIRFSAERQKFGDSVRRQVEKAEVWAKAHDLTVDTTSYRELKGVSAFKGKNRTDGHYLKAFIDAVEKGVIPKGSYLLVESLDRLSRAAVDDALELFLHINRIGITIVDVTTGLVFSRDQPKNDRVIALMTMIMVAVRANEESALKADRLSRMWANKRAEAATSGKLITKMGPIWLKVSADGTRWLVDTPKATIVRELFELSASGYGAPTIARMFNERKRPTLTNNPEGWSFTSINLLLHNRAVIGTYTPQKKKGYEPIKGYFPPIISETLFVKVQDGIVKRRWIGGRSGEAVQNLFAGYSYCYVCGEKMRVVGTSNKKKCLRAVHVRVQSNGLQGKEVSVPRSRASDLALPRRRAVVRYGEGSSRRRRPAHHAARREG
jgi:DNA invertase Pin-like site-specific DNA recombinase